MYNPQVTRVCRSEKLLRGTQNLVAGFLVSAKRTAISKLKPKKRHAERQQGSLSPSKRRRTAKPFHRSGSSVSIPLALNGS